jgi:hypothetical protein
MDRYIGVDAHASSCTLAVVSGSGKRLRTQVVETNARCLIEAVRQIPAGGRDPAEGLRSELAGFETSPGT